MANELDAEVENLYFPISFESTLVKKLAASLVAFCFVLFALAISTILLLCCYVVRIYALPFTFMVVATTVLIAFFIVLFQQRVVPGLRFCLILYPNHLQIGRGLAKRLFLYQETDRIHVSTDKSVLVGCDKTAAIVFLASQERGECVRLLRLFCHNAVFVDEHSRVHLPEFSHARKRH